MLYISSYGYVSCSIVVIFHNQWCTKKLLSSSVIFYNNNIIAHHHHTNNYPYIFINKSNGTGPHGKHVCMVFEMLGENLLEVIKKFEYKGIPIPLVRQMAKEIARGLDFLHRHCDIIHTDLKPENIVVSD